MNKKTAEEINEEKKGYTAYQNLFNTLQDVCGFVALETDMQEIIRAVEKDSEQFKSEWVSVETPPKEKGEYLAFKEYIINGVTKYKYDVEVYDGPADGWQLHAYNKVLPHDGFDKMPTIIYYKELTPPP